MVDRRVSKSSNQDIFKEKKINIKIRAKLINKNNNEFEKENLRLNVYHILCASIRIRTFKHLTLSNFLILILDLY